MFSNESLRVMVAAADREAEALRAELRKLIPESVLRRYVELMDKLVGVEDARLEALRELARRAHVDLALAHKELATQMLVEELLASASEPEGAAPDAIARPDASADGGAR